MTAWRVRLWIFGCLILFRKRSGLHQEILCPNLYVVSHTKQQQILCPFPPLAGDVSRDSQSLLERCYDFTCFTAFDFIHFISVQTPIKFSPLFIG